MKLGAVFETFDDMEGVQHLHHSITFRRGDLVRFTPETLATFADRRQPSWKHAVQYGVVTGTVIRQDTTLTGEVTVVFVGPTGQMYGQSDSFYPDQLLLIARQSEYEVENEHSHFRPHIIHHTVFNNR